jgi:archaemetzincin
VNRTEYLFVVCAAMMASCQRADGTPEPGGAAGKTGTAARAACQPAQATADPFAFDPDLFEKKRQPRHGDWLASFHEPGQTFPAYVAQAPKGLTDQRHVIVLQPIGDFTKEELAVLTQLREFTSAYFQLPARVSKRVPLPSHGSRQRRSGSLDWTQYSTLDIMKDVLLPRLPSDAVCYLGITMSDLYPDEDWNFVFGQASFDKRVGVYSLIRYTNRFWGRPETDESRSQFLRRSFKILAHETGHMFSIAHCTVNECLMNGSNSLDEMDRNTIHLCPVCLHKLQRNLKFDVCQRYHQLRDIYKQSHYEDLAGWMDRRLARLEASTQK